MNKLNKGIKFEKNQNQINSYYNSIAKGYNDLYKKEQLKKIQIIKQELKLKGNERILDVGCGTCFSFDEFRNQIIGVEPARELVYINPDAKKLIKDKKVIIDVAENISNYFEENHFDIIICLTAAHHFTNIKKALESMKLVVKQDGKIVFSLLKNSANEIKKEILKYFDIDFELIEEKDFIIFCKLPKTI